MATTTIFDVVKVSELPAVQQLTDGDYLIVNDNDPSTGITSSKTIVIDDLALATVERSLLREIKDVVITTPTAGQILRWTGSTWINDKEDDSHIILTDLSVTNQPVDKASLGGRLEYDSRLGIHNFFPADTTGPLSNHENVSPNTNYVYQGGPSDRDTLSWSSSTRLWQAEPAIVITTLNLPPEPLNRRGRLDVNGYRLDYTAPDLSEYLLIEDFIEQDPVFVRHPAYTIGGSDIDKWNEAYMWGNHAVEGYLKSIRIKEIADVSAEAPGEDDTLNYNPLTKIWRNGHPRIKGITRIDDVEVTNPQDKQILRFESRSQEWKNINHHMENMANVDDTYRTHWAILFYNTSKAMWDMEKVQIIDEIVAGNALSGGGRPLVLGDTIRLDVVPGIAADVNGDKLNVRVGKGAFVDPSNDITINPGNGLVYTAGLDGLDVNPGVSIDVLNDKVNVRYGDGITVDNNNQIQIQTGVAASIDNNIINVRHGNGITVDADNKLQILSGTGCSVDSDIINVNVGNGLTFDGDNKIAIVPGNGLTSDGSGIGITPGDAISTALNKIDVLYDGTSVRLNASNQLEVDVADYTNVPVLNGEVGANGTKLNVKGRDSQDFTVTKLTTAPEISRYEVTFATPLLSSNYNLSVTTNSTSSGVCVSTVFSKSASKFVIQTVNLDDTAPDNNASFQFSVSV